MGRDLEKKHTRYILVDSDSRKIYFPQYTPASASCAQYFLVKKKDDMWFLIPLHSVNRRTQMCFQNIVYMFVRE